MAKPLKIILLVIGGLLLLVIAALVAAAMLFDPNDYRSQIQDKVQQETGRTFALGDIKLSVFPWLTVQLADARLGNAAGFGDQPFAEIEKVKVGVKLLPLLLDKQVQADTVTLDGLHLNLAKNKAGVSNWQDLIDLQKNKPKTPEAPKPESGSQFSLDNIGVGGVTIDDGAVIYDDAAAGKHYELQKLHLETGSLNARDPFQLDLSTTVISKAPAAQIDIALGGTIKPDFATQKLDTDGLKLSIKGKAADLDIDTTVQTRLVADLTAQVFNLNALTLDASISGKSIPNGKQTLKFGGDAAYNAKQGAFSLTNGKLQAADLTLTTSITGSGLSGDAPKFAGPITIAPFSPRKLLESFGVKLNTADEKALSEASLSTQLDATPSSATLQNLAITLDQTKVKGNISVKDFATQAIAFALQIDGIDADRYLPPKSKEAGKVETQSGETRNINDVALPVDALNKLNAEGSIDLASLKIDGLKLSDIRLQLAGRGAQAKTQDLSAKLYGGSVSLNHRYTPGTTPTFALKTQLSSFQAAPFLLDFTGKDSVSGTADASADISARGTTVGALRRSLDGKIAASAKNGAVKGFNLGAMIRKAQAALAGNPNYTEDSTPETDFATISVSGTLSDGVLHSEDLSAASPLFRVGGAGDINLVDETINYTAKPSIVETSKGQGGKDLSSLNGVTIPIRLTGSLWKPKYKIDLAGAVREQAKAQVKQQLDEHKDELKQKLNDKLGDLLFGKKKKQPQEQPAEPQNSP
ncbi:AsmA family protein [Solimonas terrae]|uniref:AsmA family protein n=1 Tax=Solimonas terrae TaxID=1396819 RepID=A0A6M2BXU2_9GAMM|nr:AsmA family protein [Solimonas terrae]NGY06647.1 AsmA family protein [Solimonas terrae]